MLKTDRDLNINVNVPCSKCTLGIEIEFVKLEQLKQEFNTLFHEASQEDKFSVAEIRKKRARTKRIMEEYAELEEKLGELK